MIIYVITHVIINVNKTPIIRVRTIDLFKLRKIELKLIIIFVENNLISYNEFNEGYLRKPVS